MGATNFPTVTDRSVQYPSRVQLTPVTGQENTYDVTAVPGTIEAEGTLLNSTLFYQIRDNSVWPIANGGTGATTAAAARTSLGVVTWEEVYPVGSIYMSVSSTSPQTLFGGTWESLGTDRFIRIADPSDTLSSGGSDSVTLGVENMPSHSHTASVSSPEQGVVYRPNSTSGKFEGDWTPNERTSDPFGLDTTDLSCTIGNTGGGQAFDNRPAYVEIYAWKRTA